MNGQIYRWMDGQMDRWIHACREILSNNNGQTKDWNLLRSKYLVTFLVTYLNPGRQKASMAGMSPAPRKQQHRHQAQAIPLIFCFHHCSNQCLAVLAVQCEGHCPQLLRVRFPPLCGVHWRRGLPWSCTEVEGRRRVVQPCRCTEEEGRRGRWGRTAASCLLHVRMVFYPLRVPWALTIPRYWLYLVFCPRSSLVVNWGFPDRALLKPSLDNGPSLPPRYLFHWQQTEVWSPLVTHLAHIQCMCSM